MSKIRLKQQVESVLKEFPQGRDSDIWLTLKIWAKYYPSRIHADKDNRQFVYMRDIMDLPREDGVKRIRAHFQNDLNKYLPTSWEVAKQRKINEQKWREFMSKQTL